MLKKSLIAVTDSVADKAQVYAGDGWRITYLEPRLIRFETGSFTDEPSIAVWFRRFHGGNMTVSQKGKSITVETEEIIYTIKNLLNS